MNRLTDNQDHRSLMRQALLELRQMRSKLQTIEAARTEPIAIVGIGCRLPGQVQNPADFWRLLQTGQNAITEVPADRWSNDRFYDANPDTPGKIATRYGGFVGHLQEFDAEFFGIADREARSLDPQQRLLLEVSWEALEQAGIIPARLAGSATGVFIGISSNDYSQHLLNRDRHQIDAYLATGNSHSTAAGRLSYTLGLTGPSLAIDTACSSSLVAVHLACQSLRQQECDLALVGGVNRLLSPDFSINFSKAHMLAADGRCKTFDARADGFVRSEGCGVVVLKRLSDALAAGDRIWSLICGSAVNQDGRSSGLTVPNGPAQQAVIRQALANAGISLSQVQYIEAHGTGTALGDPIELLALGEVFKPSDSNRANKPLLIGSVKTNLGHLEAAAGIAGLIKVALCLHYREIPPHLHFQQPNPHVSWDQLPLQVPTTSMLWPADSAPIAGVSSFGFSGTNAHVVLSAAEASNPDAPRLWLDQPPYSLTLSAKTPAALQALAHRYYEYLQQNPTLDFAEVCYQVKTGRSLFAEQLTVTANSTAEAIEQLAAFGKNGSKSFNTDKFRESKLFQVESTNSSRSDSKKDSSKCSIQPLLLPTYPFQRQRYWVDIEQHKNLFVNQSNNYPEVHPLLGQRLHLSRSPEIYFSHRLSQTEPLFLAQHRVLGAFMLPAAGYMEMALAAGKQILQSDRLTLTNLAIQQPILLTEADLVVQVVLSPQLDDAYRFEVLGQRGDANWQLHATGSISQAESFASEMSQLECSQPVELADYYQTLRAYGIEYGELFQAIQQLWRGDRQARGQIQLAAQLDPAPYQCHPVLLDAAFQVIGAALPSLGSHSLYLPTGCDRLTFYKRPERICWSNVTVHTSYNATEQIYKQIKVDVQITDTNGEPLIAIVGLQLHPVTKPSASISASWQDWLYQINWQVQPLPNLPTPISIHDHLLPQLSEWLLQPDLLAYPQVLAALERLSLIYTCQAFQQLGWTPITPLVAASELAERLGVVLQHQRLLHRLLEILHQADLFEQSQPDQNLAHIKASNIDLDAQLTQLQQRYPTAKAELTLLHRCGSRLADVLRGQCNPLQLLFPQGDLTTATQLYETSTGAALMNRLVQQAVSFVLSAGRSLRILEIGAGTGGTTAAILPHLLADSTVTIDYTFTDLSVLFLQKAQQRFQDYSFVKYKVLDIEHSPTAQQFETRSYDLIIAANVLHATSDLSQSLYHIRQLLAPDGLLLLLETTQPQCWLDLIFGLTAGWWRFTDRDLRPAYPLISAGQWQSLLQNCGFEQPVAITPDLTQTDGSPPLAAPQTLLVAKAGQTVPHPPPSHWLIFADRQGLVQQLAPQLSGHVTLVQTGETYQQGSHEFVINPRARADFEQLWAAIPAPDHILYLWGLDNSSELALDSLIAATETTCTSLLHLLQTLPTSPSLWLVTQGAVVLDACESSDPPKSPLTDPPKSPLTRGTSNPGSLVPPLTRGTSNPGSLVPPLLRGGRGDHPINPAKLSQTPLWGLAKVIGLEYPALHCRCIDLDPCLPLSEQVADLHRELHSTTAEPQIALRQHERYAARLARFVPDTLPLPDQPYQLTCLQRGSLEQLTLQPTERRSPAATEVEICVAATGLNLIDVLDTLNLLPFERNWFGVECAGEISAVGSEVTEFQVGDAVVALAPGSFNQYVTVDGALVVPKPAQLSFTAAATIPAAFLTADYALRLANLQPGERILIHAAATGTGMAAVMLAHQIGAEVYATASPSKWNALEQMGVYRVMNSRTLDFVEQVMAQTQGEGVDVVFNSLAGEFIPASLSVLSERGRFVEIGKRQVWTAAQVAAIKPGATYHLIDLMAIAQQQPQLIQTRLRHLLQLVPPLPATVFPIQKVVQAFRTMQQAQHIGKIVVTHQATPTGGTFSVRPAGAYLITGGLGGLGLLLAEWLVQQGARYLVLVSRRPPTLAQTQTLQTLEQTGAAIRVMQADVADPSQLADVLEALDLPLYGVFHAAGVLDDGILQHLTWERMAAVMTPKLAGAWNLHTLTQDQPLDWFVLFSSAAALLGSPGQASHVVANGFLDALAHYRQAMGQPGLSINWGAWSEVGAAAQRQVDQQMQLRGVGAISPQIGLHILKTLLAQSTAQVGVVPIQWPEFLQQEWLQSRAAAFFDAFRPFDGIVPQAASQSALLSQIKAASSSERLTLLIAHLQTEVGKVLGLPAHRLPKPDQGFFDLGMDSLMAVELKNRLDTQLQLNLTTTTIFEHAMIRELAQHLATTLTATIEAGSESVNATEIPSNPQKQRNESDRLQATLSETVNHTGDDFDNDIETNIETNILNELTALETLLNQS
ncbi:SDR family NAD(P)-dependent oxidoreductase [Leptolyngbya sp. NK1-12]|uniref:SDR family NAD(P)-dependent oxidoreductase n=1 Tax=Leptolyngbya sp. NK1-12 TaxID=2547451 RepID=A0AA96WAA7_9CYAN|nr:SDR family NAD(P)-dependent oxidoreductase [Leptolyngbya sp. NK1-12]